MLQRRMPGRLMGSVPLWGGGLGAFKFDPALVTFTPGMAKRTSAGPFETAPIVQGKFDGSGVPDTIIFNRGDQISRNFYANIDGYQGSLNLWWTPEKDRDATQIDPEYIWYDLAGKYHLVYEHDNQRFSLRAGEGADIGYVSYTAVAGTMVHLIFRWDTKNTLDGTNYFSLSINDVHTFVVSTLPTQATPGSSLYVGSEGFFFPANAIIEGETVYRRPLFDGTYGVAANWDDSGPIDEIDAIYAAGAGADPCLITGSWDIVFCFPTDSTAGALVSGNGEAWSHPHSSGVLKHQWLEDGGYLGRPWAVAFNGLTTDINCGSGATLDDLMDDECTAEVWIRSDSAGEFDEGHIMTKGGSQFTEGWRLMIQDSGSRLWAQVYCAGTTARSDTAVTFIADGKWHHVVMYFDDAGDRKIYLAVDGKWASTYSVQTAGVGAIISDASRDLFIGNVNLNNRTWDGAIGWVAISDNDRYTVGTDFIPPRQPYATDGNSIEMWHLDEGTGALINAEVTSPGNDGTLANGIWEEQWDIETTPIVPYSVEFDGVDTNVNCGSAADIDDVPDGGVITIEGWIRRTNLTGSTSETPFSKGSLTLEGWNLRLSAFNVELAITDVGAIFPASGVVADTKWHHIVGYYDDATKTGRGAVDGIWGAADVGAGAYVSDAAADFFIGRRNNGAWDFLGMVGWCRYSNNDRYGGATGANFIPPSRLNPPASDGNTLRQFNFRDGAGTTLTDDTATANGTITFGDGQWRITPDAEIDSPGERIFNWGYVIGNDAVDEGIVETLSGLDAGQNYVVRAIAHVESASRGRPKIIIYDETNGAEITSLEGPSFTGVHDGLANAATLTDTSARFPQMLVGWTIYNITDGSSTTITAISGDMQVITGALSGGTDDDWDIGDEYRIVPPGGPSEYDDYPWIETFTFELPTIARNGAAADCVSISVKLVNGVNEGVIKWHQIELLENLVDNPSLETGAGNPWIPDGWTNSDLDAGDTQAEAAILHSGVGSLRFNAGAIASESVYIETAIGAGQFANIGGWAYSHGLIDGVHQDRFVHQSTLATLFQLDQNNSVSWEHLVGVARERSANGRIGLLGEAAIHYWDDIYVFKLDLVTLTVTPASEANSAESGGLRVDGFDLCSQPVPAGILAPTMGWIKFKYRPRHDGTDVLDFGLTTPYTIYARFDGTHYIAVRMSLADRVTLEFNDGGGVHAANWAASGLLADVEYLFEVKYNASEMILKTDGVIRATITTPINFANIPNIIYWGSTNAPTEQADAVFIAP